MPKSRDVLRQPNEAELELGSPQLRSALIQLKEESERQLDQNVRAFSYQYPENFIWDQFRRYCESVFALRILFPQEQELGKLRPKILGVPRQKREPSRRFSGMMEEDDWEYLLLLNPRDWRRWIQPAQPDAEPIPAAAEFLFEFSKARQKKHWALMMKMGLVLTQVYPEMTPQVQTVLRELWPMMMESSWGIRFGQLDAESIALGVLICPELRPRVKTKDDQYEQVKTAALNRLDGKELAWFQLIEAEGAWFDEKHDLVVLPKGKKSIHPAPNLPDRSVFV